MGAFKKAFGATFGVLFALAVAFFLIIAVFALPHACTDVKRIASESDERFESSMAWGQRRKAALAAECGGLANPDVRRACEEEVASRFGGGE